ncbi:50S ribosomal protein L24 [Candidatus Kaiserbacteria bacterium RIFCSPHIGHO2_01_FULL_49_13]|uniref:Large ribosomal subunit protein uL24 n=1 Tax=Candidatus Kaiserbacteria bacterium RIFCSPHIGHO2_01_FULL_49_13 TaxID=1798477 RepID=A0A1F6CEC9_9BACT|nr:MAG: 50S ribosomal protein L24 [Candidatus Kaiserbacteria bacterium RIFCSPHIGHO2_01_FULL_49_13]
MKIKKGDNIIVIAGKDRGKTGKVLRALPREDRVVIEGVNVRKRHQRANRAGQKGQIIEKSLPVHVSNVMIIDPKSGKQTRIGKEKKGDRFVRVAKKSGTTLS